MQIVNMMIDKRASRMKERVRKLSVNGAWCGQIHDAEMAKKLAPNGIANGIPAMWSEA